MRADAILRTMELLWDFVPDLMDVDNNNNNSLQQQIQQCSSNNNKRNIYFKYSNQHKPLAQWPLPNYQISVEMLQRLASLRFPKQYQTLDMSDVPWICQDLVLRFHRLHLSKGLAHLKKPPVESWNQALTCWANAHGDRDHPEKALYATQFFMDMKLQYKIMPDASSYSGVLRACAHHDENERARELGSKVALRVCKGVIQEELLWQTFTPKPLTYVFLIRGLANLDDDDEGKEQTNNKQIHLKEAWEEACREGVVNEHVLYELEQANRDLFLDIVNPYRIKVDTREVHKTMQPVAYDKTYHRMLMQVLPSEWAKRATKSSDANANANAN